MNSKKTDFAVIGGGPGGYVSAIRAAQLGLNVILIEKERVGGVCLNRGCIPSKAIIHASEIFEQIRTCSKIGITAENVGVDFSKVNAWKARVVKKLRMGVESLVEKSGVEILKGEATLTDSNRVNVRTDQGDVEVIAEKIVIATGSTEIEIPDIPTDGKTIIGSSEALDLDHVPKNMLIIGGGVIGLELGEAFAKFGSQVTVVEALDSLLPGFPKDLVEPLVKKLRRLKVKYYTEAKAVGTEVLENSALLTVNLADGTERQLEAEKILVTVGRKPNTTGLGLENTKVRTNSRGFIEIDPSCRTYDPSILAVGDVAGEPLLAHKASAQGLVAAEVAAGRYASFDPSVVPNVVYTDPEIAIVGMTEQQAEELDRKVIVGAYPFAGHGRAATMDRLDGFIKIIAAESDHTLLGAQIVGQHAGELIGEAVLALENVLNVEHLASLIHPHPTLSEGLSEAAEAALGRAIHIPMKK